MTSKGELTRQHIIDKSMQLLSVQGYFNTSIAGIIKATGLTKGGLYGHFRNKEEIWYAVYAECVRIWKGIVFRGVRDINDPLERLERVIENSLKNYLGGGVFAGGCFLFDALVELAGQSSAMSDHVLKGFGISPPCCDSGWKKPSSKAGCRDGLSPDEIADFLVISLNGAAPLYAASRDPAIWQHTLAQLHLYIKCLSKPS